MATSTTRLGLRKPVGTDLVQVLLDIDASMDTIDTAIDRICTSSTRPSTPFVGMRAFETDTTGFIVCVSTGPAVWRYYPERVCTSSTRPATAFVGMQIFETDTLRFLVCDGTGPNRWRNVTTSLINVVTAFTEITAPFFNQIVHYQPDGNLYRYDGSNFVAYLGDKTPRGRINGHSGNTDTGVTTTEAVFINDTFTAVNGRRYKFTLDFLYYQDAGTPGNNMYQRLRVISGSTPTATGGTLVRGKLTNTPPTTLFLGIPSTLTGTWVATGSGTFCVSGTFKTNASTMRIAGSVDNNYELLIEDIGL